MISVNITIEYDSYVKGYYLFLVFNNGDIATSDREIIEYFNLPDNYWYDNLLKLNGFHSKYKEIYFRNEQDTINAKQWIIDNLDYFLILRKLGGE